MKKNRLISLLLILSLIVILAVGCADGKYKVQNGKILNKDDLLQGDYSQFDGNYFKKIDLTEGNRITFGYAVGTVQGELSAKLINSDDNTEVDIEDRLTYEIKKTGTYKIEVIGVKHSGAFALEWKVE